MKTFEQAWAEKEAEGYKYGKNALEQVRFGWEIRDAQPVAAMNELTYHLLDQFQTYLQALGHSITHPRSIIEAMNDTALHLEAYDLKLPPYNLKSISKPSPPAGTIRLECDAPRKP